VVVDEPLVMTKARSPESRAHALVDIVVKIGGGLLGHPASLETVLAAITSASGACRILVVPGGGPFAETVRQVDREFTLSDDAAHWMAVLAMDQYAHLVTSRLATGALVADADETMAALGAARVPVLAVSRWLRDADPLPHSWEVTSDSIAAWVAGVVGARRLVLVKPPGTATRAAVDRYFDRALPAQVTPVVVPADQPEALSVALRM
jgi:aspartokinase-like uncharacterized kinase